MEQVLFCNRYQTTPILIETNNRNWLIELLQLLDQIIAVGWLNNCSCFGEQLQLFCRTSAVVGSNKCCSCTKQLQFFYRIIQRKHVVVLSKNSSNNCSWYAKQWQLFHRTTAGFHWTTDCTTVVIATSICKCFIAITQPMTVVDWSTNCSCWSEPLQPFGQTTAHVLSRNCSSCLEQMQLLHQATAVGWPKRTAATRAHNCSRFIELME